jgi:raffinose/stachyose/melibiose transport system substrate-binding protein
MKKIVTLLLTLVLVSSLFVGCGKQEEATNASSTEVSKEETQQEEKESGTEESKTSEPVELRIVTMFGGTDPCNTSIFEQQLT